MRFVFNIDGNKFVEATRDLDPVHCLTKSGGEPDFGEAMHYV
jgi:hypothetical protein